jgi:uncharacterized protein YlxW (UPF0749 family)
MNRNWQLPVALVSMLIGYLITTQFRNQLSYQKTMPSRRIEDLVQLLKAAEDAKASLEREVKDLRAKAAAPARDAGIMVGLTPVLGPGLEILIQDSSKPLTKGEDPNSAIVHNDDLLRLVNELRAGGAEVVSVNDQRLVDTSEITCAGSTILINQSRISPPFVIRAIGNPELMSGALKLRGGILEYLEFYGIKVALTRKPVLTIPAYAGSATYRYARPVAIATESV